MRFSRALVFLATLGVCHDLYSGVLDVTVRDIKGAPVADAVVYAKGNGVTPQHPIKQGVIDQQGKRFIPYVTAIQVGTAIVFPNKDNIRHHVYSLSPAKKFELPLYAGIPAAPVLFDHEGFVTLGCNIHDWMIAYVAVLTTPYFQVTDSKGHARLKDLPANRYNVEAWQPLLKGKPEQLAQTVELAADASKDLAFTLDLRPDFRPKRAPGLPTGGYP